MGNRFIAVIGIFALLYFALLFRLFDLQIARGTYYFAKAESRYALQALEAPRGAIYFTDKNQNQVAVAINKDAPMVYAVPKAKLDYLIGGSALKYWSDAEIRSLPMVGYGAP